MAGTRSTKPWYLQLHGQVGIALLAGFAIGVLARVLEPAGFPTTSFGEGVGVVGDIFLRLLKMIIIPLIFTSLVCGVASLGDARSVGRVGVRTVLYYTLSTTLAIMVGLTLVNVFSPGRFLDIGSSASLPEGLSSSSQSLAQFLLHMVPDNIVRAMAAGDVLPVIFFAILFGLFLVKLNGPNVEAVHRVMEGTLEVIQTLTLAIVKLAPIGIFALLAREVVRSGPELIMRLLPYFATVGGGLLIHAFVTLPLILLFLARRSPLEYFRAVLPAVATAFSTASSSATLPLSMECAEKEAEIPRGVSSFVLPLGATVNMDGTALYEAVAALTIAQMYGVPLDLSQQALVLLTALLASVGAAGIPMAGLVMMVVVLEAVGLPIEGIATIIAVDRILDMMRTSTNVWSDLVGTAVIARFEGRRP
jgi:Na+/H+-dicarboxylate symporter